MGRLALGVVDGLCLRFLVAGFILLGAAAAVTVQADEGLSSEDWSLEGVTLHWMDDVVPGETARLLVGWRGQPGTQLDLWADFDGDGAFGGPEEVLSGFSLGNVVEDDTGRSRLDRRSLHVLEIPVPDTALADGVMRLRFRLRGDDGQQRSGEREVREARDPCEIVPVIAIAGEGDALQAFAAVPAPARSLETQTAAELLSWTEGAWSPFETSPAGSVLALAIQQDEASTRLYVGGTFATVGQLEAKGVVMWDGVDWSPLGSGIDGVVSALAIFDDGRGATLYAAGSFHTPTRARNIARWDGTDWQHVGMGTDGWVHALAVFDDGTGPALYAGGRFSRAGDASVENLAKWDGTSWTSLAQGVDGRVWSSAVHDDGSGSALYVGGDLSRAGAVEVQGLARWNGAWWQGTEFPDVSRVENLVVVEHQGRQTLYAVGAVLSAASERVDPPWLVARWSGEVWAPPGWQGEAETRSRSTSGVLRGAANLLESLSQRVGEKCPTLEVFVSKMSPTTTATAGGSLDYGISVTNESLDQALVTVTDSFPGGLTCNWTSAGTNSSGYSNGSGSLLEDDLTLGGAGTVTYDVNCSVPLVAPGSITNTALVTSGQDLVSSDSASHTIAPLGEADISVTKAGRETQVNPGQPITYDVTVINNGPDAASSVAVGDRFPAELEECSWVADPGAGVLGATSGSGLRLLQKLEMAAGSQVDYEISCTVVLSATGDVTNTAAVDALDGLDLDASNNTATDITPISPPSNISVTKSNGVDTVVAGETVVYTIGLSNSGSGNAPSVSVVDNLPAVLQGCGWTSSGSGGAAGYTDGSGATLSQTVSMPATSTVTYEVTCTLASSATGSLVTTVTVTAASDPDSPKAATDTDSISQQPDVAVTKSSGGDGVVASQPVTYTVQVTNNGPSDAASVALADSFSTKLTGCSWGAPTLSGGATGGTSGSGTALDESLVMPAGSSAQYQISCTVEPSATGTLINTAIATVQGDPNAGDNSATDSDEISRGSDVWVTNDSSVSEVAAGENLTYTVVAGNDGPLDAASVTLGVSVPSELSCSWSSTTTNGASGNGTILPAPLSLPVGSTATYTGTCSVASSAFGSLTTTATVSTAEDPGPRANSDAATVNVTRSADLSVTKGNGVPQVVAGEVVAYTIQVTNDGPSDAPTVTVSDNFPAVLQDCSWTSNGSGGASGYGAGSGASLSETLAMPAGTTVSYEVECTLASNATGTLTNTVTVTSVSDPASPKTATDSDPIVQEADVQVTKTSGGDGVVASQPVTYTVQVTNNGPSDASAVNLTDTFSSELTGCSWGAPVQSGGATGGTLGSGAALNQVLVMPVGSSARYQIACTVNPSATGTLTNTASISALGGSWTDSDTDTDSISQRPDIVVTKTNGGDGVVAGQPVTYSIQVRNLGPSDASSLEVTDNFPSDLENCSWTCSGLPLASGCTGGTGSSLSADLAMPVGSMATYLVTCNVKSTARGTLSNSVTATAQGDPDTGNNSATDSDATSWGSDVWVTNSSSTSTVAAGESLIYTVVVGNDGPVDAASVTLNLSLPSELSCGWERGGNAATLPAMLSLSVGSTATYTGTCSVAASAFGNLTTTATVSTAEDPGPKANSDAATVNVTRSANLTVTKDDGVTQVTAGDELTYTIEVVNTGPSDAPVVNVEDSFPAVLQGCGWTGSGTGGAANYTSNAGPASSLSDLSVSMPAGSKVTYEVTCTLDSSATGALTNTATVTSDSDPASPKTAQDSDSIVQDAQVSVTKSSGGNGVLASQPLTYTVTVANPGPSDATSVSLTDTFASALTGCGWAVPAQSGGATGGSAGTNASALNQTLSMPAGSSVQYQITCTVDPSATGTLTNTASISALGGSVTDSATDTDAISQYTDIQVTKTIGVDVPVAGKPVSYVVEVRNLGPSDAASVSLIDNLPSDQLKNCTWSRTDFANATGSNESGSGFTFSETLSLAVGGFVEYEFTCTVLADATGFLENTASATFTVDPDTSNNSAEVSDEIGQDADISVTKTNHRDGVVASESVTYEIVVSNAGPSDATSVILTDTLSPQLENCTWSGEGSAGTSINEDIPAVETGGVSVNAELVMPVDSTVTYTIDCTVKAGARGQVTNTVNVTSLGDPDTDFNEASDTDDILWGSDVSVQLSSTAGAVIAGESVTYTFVVGNDGPLDADSVQLDVELPADLSSCTWETVPGDGSPGTATTLPTPFSLAVGSTATYTGSCLVASGAPGSLTTKAMVTTGEDSDTSNNSDSETVTVTREFDVGVTVFNGVDSVIAGTSSSYTVEVTNNGPSDADTVTLTMSASSDLTCSWSNPSTFSVSAGSTVSYTGTCVLSSSATGEVTVGAVLMAAGDSSSSNNSDSDTDTVAYEADIEVRKSNERGQLTAGEVFTYGITVENHGPSDAPEVALEDEVPPELSCTWTSVPSGGATGNGFVLPATLTMPAGSSVFYIGACTLASDATGTVTNTATVTSSIPDPDPSNNSSTDTDDITQGADVSVVKTSGATFVTAGDDVGYTITVTNKGPSDVAEVRVQDDFPSVVGNCSWTVMVSGGATGASNGSGQQLLQALDMPAGSSATYSVGCTLASWATGNLSNTASISLGGDLDPTNDSSTHDDMIVQSSDLGVSLTTDPSTAIAGDPLVYTLRATNHGASDDPSVTLAASLASELTGCSWTNTATDDPAGSGAALSVTLAVPASTSVTYEAECSVPAGATGSLISDATVTASNPDSVVTNNTSQLTTPIEQQSDLVVSVDTVEAEVVAGETVTYRINVNNDGPSDAASVTLLHTLPTDLTGCTVNGAPYDGPTGQEVVLAADLQLPVSSSVTYNVACTLAADAIGELVYLAKAQIEGDGASDPDESNNTVTKKDTIVARADVSVTKSNGQPTVTAGRSVSYDIEVTNDGPSNASVLLEDPLPSELETCSWSQVLTGGATVDANSPPANLTMPANSTVTYTVSCTLASNATGTLVNTATITLSNDLDDQDNKATDSDPIEQLSELVVTKGRNGGDPLAGNQVVYNIKVKNDGPSDAPSVELTDDLPSELNSCNWNFSLQGSATTSGAALPATLSLPAGDSVTYTGTCQLAANASGTLRNVAMVTVTSGENPVDNTAEDTATIEQRSDVSVSKMGPASVAAGEDVTYSVKLKNDGPSDANSVRLTDTFPGDLNGCRWEPTEILGGVTTPVVGAGSSLDVTLSMPANSSVTYDITCTVSAAAMGTLDNTATVSATGDSTPDNNTATHRLTIQESADLSVSKTLSPDSVVVAGKKVSYTIVATNNGPSDTQAVLSDQLPNDLSGCTWSSSAVGGATGNDSSLPATLSMPAGSSVTYDGTCDLAPSARGQLINTAKLTGTDDDPNLGDETSTTDHSIAVQPDVAVVVNQRSSSIAGAAISYEVTATNHGPGDADAVTLTATLPSPLIGCIWSSSTEPVVSSPLDVTLALSVGSSVTYTAECSLPSSATGIYTVSANVNTSGDPNGSNDFSQLDSQIQVVPNVSVTKGNGLDEVVAGSDITYTIEIINNGPSDAAAVTVADTLPTQLSDCAWTSLAEGSASGNDPGPIEVSELDATLLMPLGSKVTYWVTCTVQANAMGNLVNNVTVTAAGSPDPIVAQHQDDDPIVEGSDLVVSLSHSPADSHAPAEVIAGETVTHTLVVTNGGPSDASSVTLTSDLPPDGEECTWSIVAPDSVGEERDTTSSTLATQLSLPAGTEITFSGLCNVESGTTGSFEYFARAEVDRDPQPGNNEDTNSFTVVRQSDLAIELSNGVTEVKAGEDVTYTLDVRNLGPSDTTGASLTYDFPNQLTGCDWESDVLVDTVTGNTTTSGTSLNEVLDLAADSHVTYRITCRIDPEAAPGSLGNVARINATNTDPDSSNNRAEDTDTLLRRADLGVDLELTDPTGEVVAGGEVSYELKVVNEGPSDAFDVTLIDQAAAQEKTCSWQLVSQDGVSALQPDSTALRATFAIQEGGELHYRVNCTLDAAATGTVVHQATVEVDPEDIDPDLTDNTDTVESALKVAPDIEVTLTNGVDEIVAGKSVSYTLTVTNHGPSDALGIELSDQRPSQLDCDWQSDPVAGVTGNAAGSGLSLVANLDMLANTSVIYELDCELSSTANGILVYAAEAKFDGDPAPGNNYSEDKDQVIRESDLEVTLDDGNDYTVAGTQVVYALTVENRGPSDVASALLTTTLAPELTSCTWGAPSGSDFTVEQDEGGRDLRVYVSMLADGVVRYAITCSLADGAEGTVVSSALIDGQHDLNPDNNEDSDVNAIVKPADIVVQITSGVDTVAAGGSMIYHLLVSNASVWDAQQVRLHANFTGSEPACRWEATATGEATGFQPVGMGLELQEEVSLPANSSLWYLFSCKVPDVDQGSLVFTAEADSPTDLEPGNNSATHQASIVRPTDVETVILTHFQRMRSQQAASAADLEALQAKLSDFAGHGSVNGVIFDLGYSEDLAALYERWDAGSPDPEEEAARANEVLFGCEPAVCGGKISGIQILLDSVLSLYDLDGNFGFGAQAARANGYLMLVGDDRIVPLARIGDRTLNPSEQDYVSPGGLSALGLTATRTTVGRALADNRYLSDDPLVARGGVKVRRDDLDRKRNFLPLLITGRLLEEPAQIVDSLNRFLELDGKLDLTQRDRRVLVTGYDFLQDSSRRIRNIWRQALAPTQDPASLEPVYGQLIGSTWGYQTVGERSNILLQHMSGFGQGAYGIISLNGHATHYQEGVPGDDFDDIQGLNTAAIDAGLDLYGSVLYAVGCHGGLPVPDRGATTLDRPWDLAQTYLDRGALVYIANSGFGWGLKNSVGYSERLVEIFTEELTSASELTVGQAVHSAKYRYFDEDAEEFDAYDVKTSLQWTLYGFPMTTIITGIADSATEAAIAKNLIGVTAAEEEPVETTEPNLLVAATQFSIKGDLAYAKYTASGEQIPLLTVCPPPADGEPAGCYYTLNGGATSAADLPVEPVLRWDTRVSNTSQHGVLWKGGKYTEESNWTPVFARLVSNGGELDPGSLPRKIMIRPRGGSRPGSLFGQDDCRATDTAINQLSLIPAELHDEGNGLLTHRLYRDVSIETFYFRGAEADDNCDREGPLFEDADSYHEVHDSTVRWSVPVTDEDSEVWRVVVVYDDEANQEWKAIDLTFSEESGRWEGYLPLSPTDGWDTLTYFLQAVDKKGNVSFFEFQDAGKAAGPSGIDLGLPNPVELDMPSVSPLLSDDFEGRDLSKWTAVHP